jgi:hypothetical protein
MESVMEKWEEDRFEIQLTEGGCDKCNAGKRFAIVDTLSDCEMVGSQWYSEDDAEACLSTLVAGFQEGVAAERARIAPVIEAVKKMHANDRAPSTESAQEFADAIREAYAALRNAGLLDTRK